MLILASNLYRIRDFRRRDKQHFKFYVYQNYGVFTR